MGCNCCRCGEDMYLIELRLKKEEKLRLEKQRQERRVRAAKKIQAWWRGTLVRRTLLTAALRAWIIQCWWRTTLQKRIENQRHLILRLYTVQEQSAVKIQSCVRMWLCRQGFCRFCNVLCMFQPPKNLMFQNDDALQQQHGVTSQQTEFHIEIVSI